MNTSDSRVVREFSNLMVGVAEYYGKDLSAATIKVYMLGLQTYDLMDIKRALSQHMQNPDNGQFMPKVADVVRLIDGDTGSQAGTAWVKVDKALRIQGPYRDVCFDDPIIHRVIDDMGGWIKFVTRADDGEYPFQQKEFERRYQGYAGRPLPDYPKILIGIATHSNDHRGFKNRELPALVGDHERALLVYKNGTEPGTKAIKQDFARLIADMREGKAIPGVAQIEEKENP